MPFRLCLSVVICAFTLAACDRSDDDAAGSTQILIGAGDATPTVYDGSVAYEDIDLRGGRDTLLLLSGARAGLSGHVDLGAGHDGITVDGDEWVGYHGGDGVDGEICEATSKTDGCIYGGAGADTFTLFSGTISGNVIGDDEEDTINILSLDDARTQTEIASGTSLGSRPVRGYVHGGGGDDNITIGAGAWVGYHSGNGGDVCATTGTAGCVYGGDGVDTIIVSDSATFESFINEEKGTTIVGSVVLTGEDDYFESNAPPTGLVDLGAGDDNIKITGGMWEGYHGGTPADGGCGNGAASAPGCIYGGEGTDTFILSGTATIINNVVGDEGPNVIGILSTGVHGAAGLSIRAVNKAQDDGRTEIDRPVGGYVHGRAGGDTIEIGGDGEWIGYHGDEGVDGEACEATIKTRGCIYGGGGDEAGENDNFILSDTATIANNVVGDDNRGIITISSTGNAGGGRAVAGYVDGGGDTDRIEVRAGIWAGYDGGDGTDNPRFGTWVGNCIETARVAGCIYSGEDGDSGTFVLSGTATIEGSIVGNRGDSEQSHILISSTARADMTRENAVRNEVRHPSLTPLEPPIDTHRPVSGYISGQHGSDRIEVRTGTWLGYHGVNGSTTKGCPTREPGCIFGGTGTGPDILVLSGDAVMIRNIIGKSSSNILSSDLFVITSEGDAKDDSGNDIDRPVRGYIDGDGGHDWADIGAGEWVGYHGREGEDGTACEDIDGDGPTDGCIYGGGGSGNTGSDTLTLYGTATIINNVIGDDGTSYLSNDEVYIQSTADARTQTEIDSGTSLGPRPVRGYIDLDRGGDIAGISTGTWVGYHGGDGDSTCATTGTNGCIYGGEDEDIFHLDGENADAVTIGAVVGEANEADYIVLSSGTLSYVDGVSGDNVVRLLGTFGDAASGADIIFTSTCSGTAWICGGTGTEDRIEYSASLDNLIATANRNGFERHCYLTADNSNANADFDGTACDGGSDDAIGDTITKPVAGAFAVGFEGLSVPSAFGLWGGLPLALQSFGRAMMEDFTSSPTSASLARPFDFARSARFAQGDNKKDVIPSGAEESGNGRTAHLFTGQTQSHGYFHARQTQLRGGNTTHLTMQGVPGAVGTVNYSHDVNLRQQGFSTPVAQGLVAQGGFHLMQGSLTSSDGGDQFSIQGYGAGAKLAYGTADLAMLGAWFDLASDDWGRPMAFSGTQWIVSAGVEREMTLGVTKLIPQVRGFWQKTNIEEQGAIRFSDDLIFTGQVGLVAQAGNHVFGLFFTRDDDASSLDAGLVQDYRVEDAVEAGWRNTMASSVFSLAGEVRYRHGLETGVDSYSAGIALNHAF